MATKKSAIDVIQVDKASIPAGTPISKAPAKPEEAVSFKLVPLPVAEEEVLPPPELPPVEEVPPAVKKVTEKAVIIPVGVPEEFGKGEYLGVVWAVSLKEAVAQTLLKWGGEEAEYLIDLISIGPRPYFVIGKYLSPVSEAVLSQEVSARSLLSIPEAKTSHFVIWKCSVCLNEQLMPPGTESLVCPVCGTPMFKEV